MPLTNDQLRQLVLEDGLPVLIYMVAWKKLDENSEAYADFSKALIDQDSNESADHETPKDVTNPAVKSDLLDCALRHPRVSEELESAIGMFFKKLPVRKEPPKKPWWKFWS